MEKKTTNHQFRNTNNFLNYAVSEALHLKEMGRFSVANNHACAHRRFADFLQSVGQKDVSFKKMKPDLLADFEGWLKSRGICRNTSSCYLRSLSAVWNKAVRDGLAEGNPFMGTYRGVSKTRKRSIDTDSLCRLRSLDIEAVLTDNGQKAVGTRRRQHIDRLLFSRDLFLFSFCSRGLTFVDMAFLKKTDVKGDVISYVRRKTGQRIEVHVEPQMRDIISRYPTDTPYLFPILTEQNDQRKMYHQYQSAIHLYNKALGELGTMLGGLKLTSYVSRHSWTTMARQDGMGMSVISQALGHDSVRTTEIYIRSLDGNIIDQANHTLLEHVFKNETRNNPNSG